MSETRRTKRATARDLKDNGKKKLTFGANTVTLDKDKVVVETEYRKSIYKAASYNASYISFAMLFEDGISDDERNNLATALLGFESLPVYCHSDAELAGKIFDVVLQEFERMAEQVEARADTDEELNADNQAILDAMLEQVGEQ